MVFSNKKVLILTVFILYAVRGVSAYDESFLKPGYYQRCVIIENPETSILAEAFLRAGVTVKSRTSLSWSSACFSFKTQEEHNKFIVYIYYNGDFVGRYVYRKVKGNNELKFTKSFVYWLFRNAWSQK